LFDSGYAVTFSQDLFNCEPFPNLGARFRSSVDENLVEDGSPWAVRDGALLRTWRPGNRERAEVERIGADRRTSCCRDAPEQPPRRQGSDPRWMNHVRGNRIARECGTVDDEHAIALAREQHRRRRPSAPCSDNDDVVLAVHDDPPLLPAHI